MNILMSVYTCGLWRRGGGGGGGGGGEGRRGRQGLNLPPRVLCIPSTRPFFLAFSLKHFFECELLSIVA